MTRVLADFVFNTKVVLDVFHTFDAEQKRYFFLNVVDAGSRYVEVTSRHVSRRGEGDSVFECHRPQFLALVGAIGWGAGQRRGRCRA